MKRPFNDTILTLLTSDSRTFNDSKNHFQTLHAMKRFFASYFPSKNIGTDFEPNKTKRVILSNHGSTRFPESKPCITLSQIIYVNIIIIIIINIFTMVGKMKNEMEMKKG